MVACLWRSAAAPSGRSSVCCDALEGQLLAAFVFVAVATGGLLREPPEVPVGRTSSARGSPSTAAEGSVLVNVKRFCYAAWVTTATVHIYYRRAR